MIELGNAGVAAYVGPVGGTTWDHNSNSTKGKISGKDIYNDRAAAVIQHSFRFEQSRFVIEQIPDSNQISSETQKSSSLSKPKPAKLQNELIEALKAQANVEPDRALQLLKTFTV